MSRIDDLVAQWRKMGPVKWAEHAAGWIMEDGRPIRLLPWQKAVLGAWWALRLVISTLAISNVKKTGKTTLDAVLLCWRWLALPGQHFVASNDLDQGLGLQFRMIAELCKRHPFLSQHVHVTRTKLTFEPTGSELEALSVDAAGNAGANHLTSSHTEAWGVMYESGVRSYEELTPPPGTSWGFPALRIVDSYAGHLGESTTWHDLVDRGLAGELVDRKWPVFRSGGLLLFHMEGVEAQERCFRGSKAERERYYEDQQQELRTGTYRRLHLNERSALEDAFIRPEQWDALIMESYVCPKFNPSLDLVVGVDLGVKHDRAACVSVYRYRQQPGLWLGPYLIRAAGAEGEVDLASIEEALVELDHNFGRVRVVCDPWQASYLLQRLRGRGIHAQEFPQTQSRLTEAGNGLFTAIREQRLIVYPGADDLRRHVLSAAGRETPRGIRLVKGTGKIDAAIALAMAVVSMEERPQYKRPGVHRYA